MVVAVSSSHVVSATPSSSCSSLAAVWDPSHGRQLCTNCSSVSPSHRCSPSGTGCSSVGHPQSHKSCQQTCSGVGSSLNSSTGPARSLLQLPTGSQSPSGTSTCSGMGCRWISAPSWTSTCCRGTACLTMGAPWAAGEKNLLEHLLPLLLH